MLSVLTATADIRERYTVDHPLIYEDGWEKWPYSFLNSEGKADGFNVQLVKEIMQRLGIPYEIRLKSQPVVHQDMKYNAANLSMGVSAGYNAPYGRFGSVTICQFENSLLVPQRDSMSHVGINQLRTMHLKVGEGSRAHHYLLDNGMADSLITPHDHLAMAILRQVSQGKGGILWNTMSLKWLLRKYDIQGYCLVPTDIAPGEYRFMSSDSELLHSVDSVSLVMQQEGRIDQLINRWMYPERKEYTIPYGLIFCSLLAFVCLICAIAWFVRYYRTYYSHSTLDDVNSQMALILSSTNVNVWTYDTINGKYAWMTPDGRIEQEYTPFEFTQFYPGQEFNVLHAMVERQIANPSTRFKRSMRAFTPDNLTDERDINLSMQALFDDYGKVYLIVGVQYDVTASKSNLERMRTLHERHKTAFNIALGGIMRFDATGRMIDINHRMCVRLGIKNPKALLNQGYNIHDFGVFRDIDLDSGFHRDITFCTRISNKEMTDYLPFASIGSFNPDYDRYSEIPTDEERQQADFHISDIGYYYIHLMKAFDSDGNLISYIFYLRDFTLDNAYRVHLEEQRNNLRQVQLQETFFKQRRDYVLSESDIVMLRYYPENKRLFFYDQTRNRMSQMPQLRVIEMTDSRDMKRVFRAFYRADALKNQEFHLNVRTLLRSANGHRSHMEIHMRPFCNEAGVVQYYFGSCRDITDLVALQAAVKQAQKAQQL